jgi:hypothetical protein
MNETPELFVLASIHACRLWQVFRRQSSNGIGWSVRTAQNAAKK